MMICYVAVPARLIGVKTTHSPLDPGLVSTGNNSARPSCTSTA